MLEIIYASFHCSEKMFKQVFENSKQKPGQAVQKYNRLLAEGLARQKDTSVTVVCEMPITENNYCKRIYYKGEEENNKVRYIYIPLFNMHRIKDLLAIITTFFTCMPFFIRKKNIVAVADILNAPVALGTYLAAKLCRKSYVAIITDAPEFVFYDSDKAYKFVSMFLIKRASAYVFLTQQMDELYNKTNRPYTIIEGLVEYNGLIGKSFEEEINVDKRKICMYTGSIHEKYGIGNLVEGFIKANIPNVELHIYGDGDYREKLKRICQRYVAIKYFGNVLSEEVIKKQKGATLLVNPRPTTGEFTKYSFPSKNIEYMASGTPVLTTRLPGIPEIYFRYVYSIEESTPAEIELALKEIFSKREETISERGSEARKFVLEQKNNVIQAKKLIIMLNELLIK